MRLPALRPGPKRGTLGIFAVAVALLAAANAPAFPAGDAGFTHIFDGASLAGWDGNPDFWRVEEGAITGQTTPDKPTKGNTFIIWRGVPKSSFWRQAQQNLRGIFPGGNPLIEPEPGVTANFELKLEYRIVGGNSGIQYRSLEVPDQRWVISGYQADFEAGDTYSGILYSERARGILAKRGEKTEIGQDGKPRVIGSVGDSAAIQAGIKKEDWNEYHIIAHGNHFIHKINGMTTVEVIDNDIDGPTRRRDSGLLALQLHAGPPMKVQFRNIRMKVLAGGASHPATATEEKPAAPTPAPPTPAPAPPAAEKAPAKAAPTPPVEKPAPKAPAKPAAEKTATKAAPAKPAAAKVAPSRKRLAFVAGVQSHGYGAHEHKAGCMLLAKCLEQGMPDFDTVVYTGGWPKDPDALDGFDCIVMYSDGGGGHMVNRNLQQVDALMKKGVGLVCIHYAVEVPKGEAGEKFLDWIGGYFETNWSVNPHWDAAYKSLPDHPITRGVRPFSTDDEWYYHMRFPPDMEGVTPILTALPPDTTLTRPDGPHSGNPDVRKAVANGQPQHMAWARQRPDGGRGFGFTGGHNHWNWGNDDVRKLMLNAIVWTARAEVPENGVPTSPVTLEQLEANQDYPPPENFNRERIVKLLELWRTGEPAVQE